MALPTLADIDAAVPVAGTPNRALTNAALKSILGGGVYLGQVATAGRYPAAKFSSPNTQMACRVQHRATEDLLGVQFKYVNYLGIDGNGSGVDLVLNGVSFEYPAGSGTMNRVTFSGVNSVTIPTGSEVWSDPINFRIPAGALFYEFNKHTCSAGVLYSLSGNQVDKAAIGSSVTDPTSTGSVAGMGGGNFVYGFMESRGYTNKPSGALLGDSKGAGAGDTGGYGTNAVGALERAMDLAGVAWVNLCVSGAAVWQIYLSTPTKLKDVSNRASFFLLSAGINDFNGGDTAATVKTNMQSLISAWSPTGRKPFYPTTVEPQTTSTDSWATEANQTIFNASANSQRIIHNGNVTGSLIVGQWGSFDVARYVESQTNPGKWLAPGYTGDGLHELTKGYLQAQLAIPPGFGTVAMI